MNTKILQVAALKNGTVIDHLPPEQVFKVVSLLYLEAYNGQITIGNNLDSKQLGKKGIIKISDKFLAEAETNKIALITPKAIINIIRDYEVIEKRSLELPDEIRDIVRCKNAKCITNNEPVPTRFRVLKENGETILKCHYCEHEVKRQYITLNG